VLSGICVYGHFSSLYFELTVTDYTKQADAEKEAVEFVTLFGNHARTTAGLVKNKERTRLYTLPSPHHMHTLCDAR